MLSKLDVLIATAVTLIILLIAISVTRQPSFHDAWRTDSYAEGLDERVYLLIRKIDALETKLNITYTEGGLSYISPRYGDKKKINWEIVQQNADKITTK